MEKCNYSAEICGIEVAHDSVQFTVDITKLTDDERKRLNEDKVFNAVFSDDFSLFDSVMAKALMPYFKRQQPESK